MTHDCRPCFDFETKPKTLSLSCSTFYHKQRSLVVCPVHVSSYHCFKCIGITRHCDLIFMLLPFLCEGDFFK